MALKLPPLDARIPQWNLDDLIERTCPICDVYDEKTEYERPDHLTIRECTRCGTFFVCPSPSGEQLQAFYESYDQSHRPAPPIKPERLAASYDNADPFGDIRIRELSSLANIRGSRVLDIGFGRCHFLYRLKKLGAIPFGLELDTKAIEFARSLGIEVFQENITEFVSDTKFDIVALLDFVEHPLNPMDVLRKSSELLVPGGLLVIWTPNGHYSTLDKELTTFRVDLDHMQYLTSNSCHFIASELNLHVVHLETLGFPALEGIDRPLSGKNTPVEVLGQFIKAIPGFSLLNNLRHELLGHKQDERRGSYHLFCILQKPGQV